MFSSTGNLFAKNLSLKSAGIFLPFSCSALRCWAFKATQFALETTLAWLSSSSGFCFPGIRGGGTKAVDPFFALRSLAISSSLKLHLSLSSDGPQISVSEHQT